MKKRNFRIIHFPVWRTSAKVTLLTYVATIPFFMFFRSFFIKSISYWESILLPLGYGVFLLCFFIAVFALYNSQVKAKKGGIEFTVEEK